MEKLVKEEKQGEQKMQKNYDEYRLSINDHFEDWNEAKQEWQNLDMQEEE